MSPIQAVSSWIGDKKDTVTNTAKSGAEKATEVGKTAVEKAKEGIGNLKEVGVNTFGKAKDMMSPSGVEQEPAPEESAEEADDEGKCWKRWVPFMKCPQPWSTARVEGRSTDRPFCYS